MIQHQETFEEEKKKYSDTKTFAKSLAKDAQEFKNMVVRKLPLNEKKRYYYEHMGDMKLGKRAGKDTKDSGGNISILIHDRINSPGIWIFRWKREGNNMRHYINCKIT